MPKRAANGDVFVVACNITATYFASRRLGKSRTPADAAVKSTSTCPIIPSVVFGDGISILTLTLKISDPKVMQVKTDPLPRSIHRSARFAKSRKSFDGLSRGYWIKSVLRLRAECTTSEIARCEGASDVQSADDCCKLLSDVPVWV